MVEEPLRVLCAFILSRYVKNSMVLKKLYNVLLSFFIVVLCFFYKRDQDCILSGSFCDKKLLVAIRR
jgi:hypothetical protein